MVTTRIMATAAGHEDADDLDDLRFDPGLMLACNRAPEGGHGLPASRLSRAWRTSPTRARDPRLGLISPVRSKAWKCNAGGAGQQPAPTQRCPMCLSLWRQLLAGTRRHDLRQGRTVTTDATKRHELVRASAHASATAKFESWPTLAQLPFAT